MGHTTPGQTPEGRLIEQAAKYSGQSARALAANAGMSDTRWRQVVRGWQPGADGNQVEARASAVTLARMALAVGVTAQQLTTAGRSDAAQQLERIEAELQTGSSVVPLPATGAPGQGPDEIDMIYASNSMSAAQKLNAIRKVLLLRAQAEAEAQRESPALEPHGNGEGNAATQV
jgi:hypothetical protein